MSDSARILADALTAAFRPHVARRLADRGIDAPEGFDGVLASGEAWLQTALDELLALPFERQRRGPLEVFQESMRFPTHALVAAGVAPVRRDPAAEAALPGDLFDMAPASSRQIGDDVWRAHLAWGVDKARAMSRPIVGVLSDDLLDTTRIEAVVSQAGYRAEVWRRVPEVDARRPVVAFVDLSHREADDVIRAAASIGIRVIGYGPHVDDLSMVRARSLGASDAVARSRFFSSIPEWLPRIV